MATALQSYQPVTTARQNTFWKLLPWAGILSLVLAFCCGIAALIIGIVSNSLPLNSWKLSTGVVQPSVLLSTVATLANALLRIAFAQGVTIQWWLQTHRGVSIGELCALYTHGTTTRGLFTMLSNFNRVTFAAFVTLLLLADGPILQRASSIHSLSHSSQGNITVPISASPLVSGATGILTTHDDYIPSTYTTAFSQAMQQYSLRDPITIPSFNLSGMTTMNLLGPGWDVQCENGSSLYHLMSYEDWERWGSLGFPDVYDPPVTQTVFDIAFEFVPPGTITLQLFYKSTIGINGTLTSQNCSLQEAMVRYPILIDNGVVTLQPMLLSENRTEYMVYRTQESIGFGNQPSTVGGFYIALSNQYTTSANLTIVSNSGVSNVLYAQNPIANQFIEADSNLLIGSEITWSDPTGTIIAAMNEISLRAAIDLSNQNTSWSCAACTQPEVCSPNLTYVNRTTSQQVSATTVTSFNAYQTDLAWLISGCAIIALACVAVMPMYWGWWQLDRSFTLDPLETAKAFDAPILWDTSADAPPAAWSQSLQQRQVHYGRDEHNMARMMTDATTAFEDYALKVLPTRIIQETRESSASLMSTGVPDRIDYVR